MQTQPAFENLNGRHASNASTDPQNKYETNTGVFDNPTPITGVKQAWPRLILPRRGRGSAKGQQRKNNACCSYLNPTQRPIISTPPTVGRAKFSPPFRFLQVELYLSYGQRL